MPRERVLFLPVTDPQLSVSILVFKLDPVLLGMEFFFYGGFDYTKHLQHRLYLNFFL